MNSITIRADKLRNMLKSKRQRQQNTFYMMHLVDIDNTDSNTTTDKFSTKLQQIITDEFNAILSDIPPGPAPSRAGVDHHIELLPDTKPISQPGYRASNSDNDELKKQIDELLNMGFIRPSTSPYASPVLFVKKKDGTMRMCIDYRALNKVTVKNKYPLPHTDELFERLTNAQYLTKLDLRSGYHQIRMAEDSIAKTAFTTRYGLYEYVVMPFGLCNAPATFMAMMNNILRSELDKSVIVFLDDILIYSATQEQHILDVRRVFSILQQHKLYVKLSKCEFGTKQCEFLGHIVGGGNIAMSPGKVKTVNEWPIPKSISELRQFLGMCNYYRKFIKNYSEIARPMYELLKGNIQYTWSNKQQLSFDKLKQCITTEPVLKLPDDSKPWIIYSDASGYAVGGVLCQDHGSGPQPVLYASHKLSGCELNWPTHDKELFGIVFMVKTCKPYLQGRKVTIYTDHKSLQYVKTQPHLSAKQTRWVQFLDTFDWEVQYKEGKLNVVADAVSRRPDLQDTNNIMNDNNSHNNNSYNSDDDDILNNTNYVYAISSCDVDDDFIQRLKESYEDDSTCRQLLLDNGNKDFTINNNLIYRGNKLYIPPFEGLQQQLIYEYHDTTSVCHRV